ncbi:hypothetical protein ACS0TY_032373 [Phlomoides rotata]
MCLKLAARLMMWSLPVLVVLTWLTNTLSVGVLGHAKCPQTDFGCLSTGSIHDAENISACSSSKPCLCVALAPGGLMTAFLMQHDVRVNGAARSASTSRKFGTTFATGSPLSMKARLGISKASHCSQWFRDKFTHRKAVCNSKSVTVRCEQSTKEGGGLDVWLGRLPMVGFAAAISVEIAIGKGLLEVCLLL